VKGVVYLAEREDERDLNNLKAEKTRFLDYLANSFLLRQNNESESFFFVKEKRPYLRYERFSLAEREIRSPLATPELRS